MQRTHAFVAVGAVALAATLGAATARRPRPAAPLTAAAVLAALPAGDPKASATDRDIATWRGRLTQKPSDERAWAHLGDALMQKGRESLDHRWTDWAESAYRQALALDPKRADVLVGLAWVASQRHRFEEAIDWGKRALVLDAQIPEAHGLIGDAQLETGDWDGAFVSYQTMLDIRPDLSSYSRGADLLYRTGDTRKAIYLMEKAIAAGGPRAENTAWCRAKLAEMLFGIGAVLPARQVLDDAAKRTPHNVHVLVQLGRVQAAQGQIDAAVETLRRAAALAPEQPQALILLGDIHRAAGRPADAETCYRQVEALDARHPKATPRDSLPIARFWAERGRRLGDALTIAAANRDARSPQDLDTLAWCHFQSGKLAEAKALSDRAREKAKTDPTILYHAGMIAAKQGERAAAQALLYQALSRNPHFSVLEPTVAAQTLETLGATPRKGAS